VLVPGQLHHAIQVEAGAPGLKLVQAVQQRAAQGRRQIRTAQEPEDQVGGVGRGGGAGEKSEDTAGSPVGGDREGRTSEGGEQAASYGSI
jgi:hypothetical protein